MPVTQANTACHDLQNDGVGAGNRVRQVLYFRSLGKRSVNNCFHSNISLVFHFFLKELLFAGGRQIGLDVFFGQKADQAEIAEEKILDDGKYEVHRSGNITQAHRTDKKERFDQ